MIRAFHTAAAGAKAFESRLDIVSQNMANLQTTGYKAQTGSFTDCLYQEVAGQEGLSLGTGAKIDSIAEKKDQGRIDVTGQTLDFAILGEGYFCVRGADGTEYFTRAGNFQSGPAGGEFFLKTAGGDLVLDQNKNPIAVPENADDLISPGIFGFENPDALIRSGDGRYLATDQSGAGATREGAAVQSGALEGSNADITKEMEGLLAAQRGFSLCAKIITTADELEYTANSLRT